VRSHLNRLAALREMAIRDGLTQCYNHKFFRMRMSQEVARAHRYGAPLTAAMIDVDRFKSVNDTYGHRAGDMVLSHLGGLVVASVRATDVVARYGGEEFAILMVQRAPKRRGSCAAACASGSPATRSSSPRTTGDAPRRSRSRSR